MKYRYFVLNGNALKRYEELEKQEFNERESLVKALDARGDLEGFRLSRSTGKVFSVRFKDGKQPAGFVKVKEYAGEMRPHQKSKDSKEFREFLKENEVKTFCQQQTCTELELPDDIIGEHEGSRSGMALYGSTIGHVKDKVIAKVPDDGKFEAGKDMTEIKTWEYEKLVEEGKEMSHERCYVL